MTAAPRLSFSQKMTYVVSVATGSNGSTIQLEADSRSGGGQLNLQASSTVPWLQPTVGPVDFCAFFPCITIKIALQTSTLAKGIYTGFVTISDPNAVDAPQIVTVTVQVGGAIPDQLEFYVAQGGSDTKTFNAGGSPAAAVSTQTGGPWLSVNSSSAPDYGVTVAAGALAPGDYKGSVALSGSNFAPDNKTISVIFHVTAQPIARSLPSFLEFKIAQGAGKQSSFFYVFNGGQGNFAISTVSITGATWLTATTVPGGVSAVADPAGLNPGTYQGTITVASNAANTSLAIPVTLYVEKPTAPVVFAGRAVSIGNYASFDAVAQGDVIAIFGDQLSYGDAVSYTGFPMPIKLDGTQAFLNDQAMALYYSSPGQINAVIPINAAIGNGLLRVERNGQRGNNIVVEIVRTAPRMFEFGDGPSVIFVLPDAFATLTAIPSHPAHPGDTVIVYAVGLGPTNPTVANGDPAPSTSPLAVVEPRPQVCFGTPSVVTQALCVTPDFVGLTPTLAGLYQMNLTFPQNVPKGNAVPVFIQMSDSSSPVEHIVIQ